MLDALTQTDAADAAALSSVFGWPHRLADWQNFLRLGQGVAWRENDVLQGTAMWFALDAAHGAIGLVQVAPGLQGRGIGRRLMRAVIDQAQPRSLLLHATAEGAGLYASLGFVAGEMIQQWQGGWTADTGGHVGAELSEILRLDRRAMGFDRGALLRQIMDAAVSNESGFAMRRHFGRGQVIGPVVADGEASAIRLVSAIATNGFIRLDIPASAARLAAQLRLCGLACVGEVQAMTKGDWPQQAGPMRRYALASQALG